MHFLKILSLFKILVIKHEHSIWQHDSVNVLVFFVCSVLIFYLFFVCMCVYCKVQKISSKNSPINIIWSCLFIFMYLLISAPDISLFIHQLLLFVVIDVWIGWWGIVVFWGFFCQSSSIHLVCHNRLYLYRWSNFQNGVKRYPQNNQSSYYF